MSYLLCALMLCVVWLSLCLLSTMCIQCYAISRTPQLKKDLARHFPWVPLPFAIGHVWFGGLWRVFTPFCHIDTWWYLYSCYQYPPASLPIDGWVKIRRLLLPGTIWVFVYAHCFIARSSQPVDERLDWVSLKSGRVDSTSLFLKCVYISGNCIESKIQKEISHCISAFLFPFSSTWTASLYLFSCLSPSVSIHPFSELDSSAFQNSITQQ